MRSREEYLVANSSSPLSSLDYELLLDIRETLQARGEGEAGRVERYLALQHAARTFLRTLWKCEACLVRLPDYRVPVLGSEIGAMTGWCRGCALDPKKTALSTRHLWTEYEGAAERRDLEALLGGPVA